MRSFVLFSFCLFNYIFCQELNSFFENINKDFLLFNQKVADIAWESSVNPGNPKLPTRAANLQRMRIKWQQNVCGKLATLSHGHLLNSTQQRQSYLLCRGPVFKFDEVRTTSALYEELQSIYSDAELCIQTPEPVANLNETDIEDAILYYLSTVKQVLPTKSNNSVSVAAKVAASEKALQWIDKTHLLCLMGEEDMDRMMKSSNTEEVLRWLWLAWREKVGPPMRKPYSKLVEIENVAARRNGYHDIGSSWRDEVETSDLRQLCRQLYEEIKPLYSLLHGVARFHLRRRYADDVEEYGAIPAHLLGNLWSQNWETLAPIITHRSLDLDNAIKAANWSVHHMLKRAEDFYQSLGLPPMTESFWSQSVFRKTGRTRCHGTAADMYRRGDYRLLYCSGTSAEDFYVIHHEMGHIQYYMAYEHQPAIFRNAHSVLHETIGDTIMYGVLTPQHLYRLGLVNDSVLYAQRGRQAVHEDETKGFLDDDDDVSAVEMTADDILLLKLALAKIPQIPFALLIEEYRWKFFEGSLNEDRLNQEFWELARELQGIKPPGPGVRGEEYYDIGAKFHVPDNTPYVRYFLSYFLQHQLFESLCKAAVFGRRGVVEDLPPTITLNRCDIYGSKAAGKLLKDLMSRGHSQHWQEILQATTGSDVISAAALKRYYRPLYHILEGMVRKYRIPIGW